MNQNMNVNPDQQNQFQDIQSKSTKGIKWQGIAEIFIRIFQLLTTIILARLLVPEDFGLISVALIFTQFAYVIFDFGFSTALVQKKEVKDEHYSTTFVAYLAAAFVFTQLVILGSPWIARFFSQPVLQNLLNTLTVVFFLYAFGAIPRIMLIKSMRFKRFGLLQIISVFSYGMVTIILAWQGAGVWSFVAGIICEQFILTVLLYIFAGWRVRFIFRLWALKEIIGFGGNVLGTRIVGYFNANAANFMIGRLLGAIPLGFYAIAYQLVEIPVQRVSKTVLRVVFPALSKLQDNTAEFVTLYKQTVYHLALIIFPVFAGIFLIAPQFIRILYGDQWLPAIVPLQILTAVGLFRAIWVTTSMIFLARGYPQVEFRINMLYFIFLIPSIFFASRYGIDGVAAAIAIVLFIFLVIAQSQSLRLINIRYGEFIKVFFIPVSGIAGFVSVSLTLKFFILKYTSDFLQLVAVVLISIPIYALIVFKQDRAIFTKISKFFSA